MKVQLVVVRGKPEGKVIPLVGPNFKIGRGETCHLRPNSEQVSREHAEFTISGDAVIVRDLGSRNGTLVNGKALTAECRLKDRDLVQVGPLTFAVSISDVAAPRRPKAARPPSRPGAGQRQGQGFARRRLGRRDRFVAARRGAGVAAEKPTAVYGGDTITITAFKDAKARPGRSPSRRLPPATTSTSARPRRRNRSTTRPRRPTISRRAEEELDESDEDEEETRTRPRRKPSPEEFMDESNPFYAAKKAQKEQAKQTGPAKPSFKDTSDAAGDILRRLMERRRAAKE